MASAEPLYGATIDILRQHRAEIVIDRSTMTVTGEDTRVHQNHGSGTEVA